MGAAIIRGVLTYSLLRGDDVADSMIDTVITVAGAHDGSNDAACAYGSACDVWSQILVRSKARQAIRRSGFNRDRPAVYDLAAGDDWYEWANQPEAELPPHIAYFNFYADIDAQYCAHGTIPSLNGVSGPFSECVGYPIGAWGDGVLAAGTPGPYDWPGSGGARFLPEAGERWEARLQYLDNEMRIEGNPLNAMDYPAFHSNVPKQSAVLTVPNCGNPTRGAVPLATQLTRIILSKTSRAYGAACPLSGASE